MHLRVIFLHCEKVKHSLLTFTLKQQTMFNRFLIFFHFKTSSQHHINIACLPLCLQVKNSGMWLYMETGTTALQSRSLMWWNSLLLSLVLEGRAGSSSWASASGSTGGERRERAWATTQVRWIIVSQPSVLICTDIPAINETSIAILSWSPDQHGFGDKL